MVWDFNTHLSVIDRKIKEKVSEDIDDGNNIINNFDLTGIYRMFYPTTAEYTFISRTHGTFIKMPYSELQQNLQNIF